MLFDYLGGLSLAVESQVGAPPETWILQHADPGRAGLEPLATGAAGRTAWALSTRPGCALMAHGYAGARTHGPGNFWRTSGAGRSPTRSGAKLGLGRGEIRVDDAHQLGLPRFLAEGHNAHAKAHMLAILMVAAQRGYWRADADGVRRLGGELASWWRAMACPAAPTSPHHPMWAWLAEQLSADDAQALQERAQQRARH